MHAIRQHLILCAVAVCCVALQICEGAAEPVKSGIGIFDTLFIASNASMHVHGDVYLKQAHVQGKGRLTIQGYRQQRIVSSYSEIGNLEIITKGKVSLEGELAVKQSLTVHFGTFDISAGKLDVTDSTKIDLRHGANVQSDIRITALPLQSGQRLSVDYSPKIILPSFLMEYSLFWQKILQQYPKVTRFAWPIHQEVAFVPPEMAVPFRNAFNQKILIQNKIIT